jgi:transposase
VSVREVAKRYSIAESLIYNWRSVRRQAAALASEPLAFIPYAVVSAHAEAPSPQAPQMPAAQATSTVVHGASEDLLRPHPGNRPGGIDIDLPSGVRLSVDSYVNEKALARVLRTLQAVP